jgi:hypothetical protein
VLGGRVTLPDEAVLRVSQPRLVVAKVLPLQLFTLIRSNLRRGVHTHCPISGILCGAYHIAPILLRYFDILTNFIKISLTKLQYGKMYPGSLRINCGITLKQPRDNRLIARKVSFNDSQHIRFRYLLNKVCFRHFGV